MNLRSLTRTVRASLLARDVTGLWIAEAVALAMGLVQAIVVARILGPRDFGEASLILSSTSLVFSVFDPRARDAVIKYLAAYRTTDSTEKALAVPRIAYAADVLLGLVAFGVLGLTAEWNGHHVIRAEDAPPLVILFAASSLLAAPSATSRAVLAALRRFSHVALLEAAENIFRAALTLLLVSADFGVRGVIYAAMASVITESLVASILAHRAMRQTFEKSWIQGRRAAMTRSDLRQMLRFMAYTDLTSLAAVLFKEADLVVLGYARGPVESGYYRLARLVASPMVSLTLPLQQAVYPRLAEMITRRDREGLQSATRRYTRIGVPIAATVLLAVPLVPVLVPLVAGSSYRPAVGAATLLIGGGAVLLPAFWISPTLLAAEHLRFLFLLNVAIALPTLAGYFILGHAFGSIGVATSRVVFAGLGGTGGMVLYCRRAFKEGSLVGSSQPILQDQLDAGELTLPDASMP